MLNFNINRSFLVSGIFFFWLNFLFWGLDEEHFIMFALLCIFVLLYTFLKNILSHSFFSKIEFIYLFFLYLIKLNLNLLKNFFFTTEVLKFQMKYNYEFLIVDILNNYINKLVTFDFFFWYSSFNFIVTDFFSKLFDVKNSLHQLIFSFSKTFMIFFSSSDWFFFLSGFSKFRLFSLFSNILKNTKSLLV